MLTTEELVLKEFDRKAERYYKTICRDNLEDGELRYDNDEGLTYKKSSIVDRLIKELNLQEIPTITESDDALEESREGVLNRNSPKSLREDKKTIIQSIKLDVGSIIYALFVDDEIKNIAIEEAKIQGFVFSSYNIPYFLALNMDVIKQSIMIDNYSSKYINWLGLSSEEKEELEKYIIENNINVVINSSCPETFKRNLDFCFRSAMIDPQSPAYFDWNYFSEEEVQVLIKRLAESNFIINQDSPSILLDNMELCSIALEADINNMRFFSNRIARYIKYPSVNVDEKEMPYLRKMWHILLKNNYYSLDQFKYFSCLELKYSDILDSYLRGMNVEDEEKKKIISESINFALSYSLKTSALKKIYYYIANKKWEEYRAKHQEYYTNIFNRVCDSIESNASLFDVLNELNFLRIAEDVLEEKKYLLFNSFIEYHQIYHDSRSDEREELLRKKRDQISEMAALFVSKSKEDFIQNQMELYEEQCKKLFKLRTDNPIVKKKVIEVKQRDMLKKKYHDNDEDILTELEDIKNRFSSVIDPSLINLFISRIIDENASSIDTILRDERPERYNEYKLFDRISKVINRLNSHNITIDNPDASEYKDFISYDNGQYVYCGQTFSEDETRHIQEYQHKEFIFNRIKSEIMKLAKNIDKFDHLSDEDIKAVIDECPFTDEYYSFNFDIFNNYNFRLFDFIIEAIEENDEINIDNCSNATNFFVSSGLFHILHKLCLDRTQSIDIERYISPTIFDDFIKRFEIVKKYQSISSLSDLLDLFNVFEYGDDKQISMLGVDLINKIYNGRNFTSAIGSERVTVACDLVSAMRGKSVATVPYINGQYHNYHYSMYDSTDITLLSSGLDTQACFRVCGNDNDFLHYCALDKNGFVIKLTDNDGKFIGRASGFRNGNGVYINQLRTIYDRKAIAYKSEKKAIIQAFRQACHDIVEESQNNPLESNKIDFVVATKSYSLADEESNIDSLTKQAIGQYPMDTSSEDWEQFTKTTKNLYEKNGFTTDYPSYSLICVASAVGSLNPNKIKKGDVPALYKRKRKEISVSEANSELEEKVNQIRAIYSHQINQPFCYITIPQDCNVLYGDNWYIIIDNLNYVDGCCLINDEFAQKEYKEALDKFREKRQDELLLASNFEHISSQETPNYSK